ncbi:hypothetical protein AWJ20_1284 [Sugiyamaella lignohabitans]|uniref:Rab-GAP TBC domain-containing protein n=1 Tax=Sugiyamaella lignohabitans TaxID=796027 RepID=A0A167DKA6_9ASCO|nr:uncharacterized protein AWJ20_1284 [Sugiyamaella lignohabitans]ANB13006.1 hypothetical protein AWJ20_1284 [Sugiyamaella lignohabitans]
MAISVLGNDAAKNNFKLEPPSKLPISGLSIKKSPLNISDSLSLVADFEEISLSSNFASRNSISDSLRDSLSTTVSSSSPNYFSDASSTRSSGDSSNEEDLDSSTANTTVSTSSISPNSAHPGSDSRHHSIENVSVSSTMHKLPIRLPSATDVTKSFADYRSSRQSKSSHTLGRADPLSPPLTTGQQHFHHQRQASGPQVSQSTGSPASSMTSTMTGNRPLADDYTFVHKRLARQRSIGSGHRSNGSITRIQPGDINPLNSIPTDIVPPSANTRRASTGTTSNLTRTPSRMAHPAPAGSRRSTPLLRKALSSSHLSQAGLGIYPVDKNPSQSHGAHTGAVNHKQRVHPQATAPIDPQIRPKLRTQRSSGRLSAEQLELQYDHDEGVDYDLPEDALMWNVPLSPALYAKSRQNSLDGASKAAGTGVNSSGEPLSPPSAPSSAAAGRKRRSSVHNSPDVSTLPSINEAEPVLYSSGLENLGKDAQDLTIALTQSPNCNDFDRRTSVGSSSRNSVSSSGYSSRRQSLRRVSSTSSFGENSLTSDISQYSLSSKTRPTGLPPKTLDEEQKHLKEFSKILEKAAAADKKRRSKQEAEQRTREKQREIDELEWKNKVMPNLSKAVSEKSSAIRELWWRGIPSQYREQVWKQKIGNELQITAADYNKYLSEASRSLSPKDHQLIASDTRSVFAELQIFGENGPLHDDLVNIIKAYAIYRPKVGYKFSITSMSAVLLLNMSSSLDAFIALANMLEGSLTMALLMGDDRTVTSYYTSFLKVLHTKVAPLYRHFQHIQLPPSAYLEPMLSSQFTNHLSIDIVHRIWDVYVFEGDAFLLRVALGVILSTEHRLYGDSAEILNELGWAAKTLINVGDEDSFMQTVRGSLKA